jgi:two-component system invasion response regulator UvrY
MLRVLIADDHPIVRMGVRNLLRKLPEIAELLEAATKDETLETVRDARLDLVVMNTTLVDADAIEVLRSIKKLQPELPVILLHPEPDSVFARLALANGAAGIVTKAGAESELVMAIRVAAEGGVYVCSTIMARMNGSNEHT